MHSRVSRALASIVLSCFAPSSGSAATASVDVSTVPGLAEAVEPNPYLSIPLPGARPDYTKWLDRGRQQVAVRRTARAQDLVAEPRIVEREPVPGANDQRETAQPLAGFRLRRGTPAAFVTGGLDTKIAQRVPAPEDDGDLGKATDLMLPPDQIVRIAGSIGDGPHGRAGSGSGDFDFFVVRNVRAGATLRVFASAGPPARLEEGPIDPSLSLYDAQGSVLTGDSPFLPDIDQIQYTVPATGDYYIGVTAFPDQFLADPFDSASGYGAVVEGEYELVVAYGASPVDTDYYSFELEPGDILGARVDGGPGTTLALGLPNGLLAVGSGVDLSFIYPNFSPLPLGGNASVAHVATVAGRHTVAVSHAGGTPGGRYEVEMRLFRPVYDGTPRRQTIFLDFDGARLDMGTFGGVRVAALSPLVAFLADFGLAPGDENALIDAVLARVRAQLADVRALGLSSGFQIAIENSRDHADRFGQPDVSRVVVGGSIAESGLATIGIAEAIDVGNFADRESALVLLDILSLIGRELEVAPQRTRVELVAAAIANTVLHEMGHLFGNFHTSYTSPRSDLMDTGDRIEAFFEVGADGVFGSRDDVPMHFGNDDFFAVEGMRGTQDTLNRIGFGLETQRAQPLPATRLDVLVPGTLLVGDLGAQVLATGEGFTPLSRVMAGSRVLTPRFEHRKLLTVPLDPELVRAPGSVRLRVVTPGGGGSSRAQELGIARSVSLLRADFEAGETGGFEPSAPMGRLGWVATTHRSASGTSSFYFGDPSTFTYDTGEREAGVLTSAPLRLPAGAVLRFASYLRTEQAPPYDEARVEISSDGFATSRLLLSNHTGGLLDGERAFASGAFQQLSADLSDFAGQTVQLRFSFDSFDSGGNAFEGWYVDDVAVLAPAAQR